MVCCCKSSGGFDEPVASGCERQGPDSPRWREVTVALSAGLCLRLALPLAALAPSPVLAGKGQGRFL